MSNLTYCRANGQHARHYLDVSNPETSFTCPVVRHLLAETIDALHVLWKKLPASITESKGQEVRMGSTSLVKHNVV